MMIGMNRNTRRSMSLSLGSVITVSKTDTYMFDCGAVDALLGLAKRRHSMSTRTHALTALCAIFSSPSVTNEMLEEYMILPRFIDITMGNIKDDSGAESERNEEHMGGIRSLCAEGLRTILISFGEEIRYSEHVMESGVIDALLRLIEAEDSHAAARRAGRCGRTTGLILLDSAVGLHAATLSTRFEDSDMTLDTDRVVRDCIAAAALARGVRLPVPVTVDVPADSGGVL